MAFVRTGTTLHIATDTSTVCGATGSDVDRVTDDDLICGRCMSKSLNANEEIPFGTAPFTQIDRWLHGELTSMPYGTAYLKTSHWQTMRRLALEHYGSTCVLCNQTPVQVHHRTYDRRGRERLDDLIVLCDKCHREHHGKAA